MNDKICLFQASVKMKHLNFINIIIFCVKAWILQASNINKAFWLVKNITYRPGNMLENIQNKIWFPSTCHDVTNERR